jgi:pSer/pThr/pTyr-binding forkhead associated (FHA) protein
MAILPRWQLRFTRTKVGHQREVIEFRCDDLDVGRKGCDLTLPGGSVSRRHCAFVVDDSGRLVVADQGSTNGTFLNDGRLRPAQPVVVRVGDRVRIGDWQLVLDAEPEPVAAAMARSARLEAERDRAEAHRR